MIRVIVMLLGSITAISVYLATYVIRMVRGLNLSRQQKIIPSAMSVATVLIAAAATWSAVPLEAEEYSLAIPSSGVYVTGSVAFHAYHDVTGTRLVKLISWGTLEPGQTANFTMYVKNEGNVPLYAAITWNEVSWQPENASQYFDLSWSFGETSLRPNRARKVLVQLHVHSDIHTVEDFSFDVVLDSQSEPFTG